MKPAEVREMSIADLHDRIQVEKKRLDTLRLNHSVSPVENTSEFKKIRKDIARMITILAEKEKAQKN
ncbi:MAG: 50S ribosomal protein L29 [Bacteroidales bacterium]|jgi:large subunit ribosomal protein L29|nr:50S ribosomal protein L29 [Bacteroidales bacterium]MDY2935169.1 50S ribosomal protein L29 [Candidatus Cryptobacteroides sp.]MCH3940946.1 50S ribosomal protein L29 [Bacteroidales bacterium]MCI2108775.1 50S ribosomal protein L29 [Bacteroidales bacterium]MCI5720308.1 50S ribosomal protein L29 [Bacteroidales bacterium]